MKCPHCATVINIEWYATQVYSDKDDTNLGMHIMHGECPQCDGMIAKVQQGTTKVENYRTFLDQVVSEQIIYPNYAARPIEPEVPDAYAQSFHEACAVLNTSPKASAALSRRLLQMILRQEFTIHHKTLDREIDQFIQLNGVPSHLSGAVDAIRNIGNLAAHPLKNTNTGEIVDVEPGEAEWLLDVLEAMFDFTFVQPKRLEERKQKLNDKLKALGKPPMKE